MVSIGAVGGIREGAYTSWTKKWSMTPPNGFYANSDGAATYIDETNGIFYLWWQADSPRKVRFGTFKLSDHTTIYASPSDEDYLIYAPYCGGGDYGIFMGAYGGTYNMIRSHQTYIVTTPYLGSYGHGETLLVWRSGSLIWSRDIKLDTGESGAEATSFEISLTGKYLFVFDLYSVKLWLYEGS